MKALTYRRYGSPDVLGIEDIATPAPGPDDVLVRVRASVVTPPDVVARSGRPLFGRLYFGMLRPKYTVLGAAFAGDVTAVGDRVEGFAVGDRVVGTTAKFGAHAEYILVPGGGELVHMPASLDYADVVAIVDGGMTALPFLRDVASIRPGQRVLVNGASGCVGSAAVQLAKHLGAEVTGVCSTPNLELVRSLGADHVIDYTVEDFTIAAGRYDVIFDTVNTSSFGRSRRALAPGGAYLATGPTLPLLLQMAWTSRFGGKRAAIAFTGLLPTPERTIDLAHLTALGEAGTLVPVIDRSYPLCDGADAHRYVESKRKRGNVVVTM